MYAKYEYAGTCLEEQAKGLINLLIEEDRKIMIKIRRIYPRNFSTSYYGLIYGSVFKSKSLSEDKEKFEDHLKSVKLLQKESEESKVMPLTSIIWRKNCSEVRNSFLYCMENEEILQIYNNLTDISKLLNGWRVGSICTENLEKTEDIIGIKRLVSNLPSGYYLSSFEIFFHPGIRLSDHYCDPLKYDSELSFCEGNLKIRSKKELSKFKEKFKFYGISLENCKDRKLLLKE